MSTHFESSHAASAHVQSSHFGLDIIYEHIKAFFVSIARLFERDVQK